MMVKLLQLWVLVGVVVGKVHDDYDDDRTRI